MSRSWLEGSRSAGVQLDYTRVRAPATLQQAQPQVEGLDAARMPAEGPRCGRAGQRISSRCIWYGGIDVQRFRSGSRDAWSCPALSFPISDHRNDRIAVESEIGLILHAEFPGSREVRDRLTKRLERLPGLRGIAALALFNPGSPGLPTSLYPTKHVRELGAWASAMHIGARHAGAASFVALTEAMISRPWHSRFDAQPIVNIAVADRLSRDGEATELFVFSPEARIKAIELVTHLAREQRLPVACYDAVAERWRAARATLFDAIHAGLDLG